MVKKELIKAIAEKTNMKVSEVESILKIRDEIIMGTVAKGEKVKDGLGVYERRETKGREGVSKLGGVETPWKTEDSYKPVFVANKQFKESVK